MNIFLGLLVALGCLALGGLGIESLLERRDRRRYPAPGQLFTLPDGRGQVTLHLLFRGERASGQPLVVLETGMGSWSFYWRLVQPEIARDTRVCSYDRPGFGWSPPKKGPRTPQVIATELHAALHAAGEAGPYLLVGHSLGGLFVRQFARLYPEEVGGLVLVDSAHEDQLERMPWARAEARNLGTTFTFLAALHRLGVLRLLGKPLLANFASLRSAAERREFLAVLLGSRYFQTTRDESLSLLSPIPSEERLQSLGDRALVVIQACGVPEKLPRGYTPERWVEQRRAWDAIQQELLSLSTHSLLLRAERSIHTVQVEQPEVVIEAICSVLHQVHLEPETSTEVRSFA